MNTIFRCFLLILCFIGTLPHHSLANDQTQLLKDIVVDTPSSDEERITFMLNSAQLPKIFAIKGKNPRVVFDFPNTRAAATLNNIIDTNGNLIKKIRIGIHEGTKPKTRVVLDLSADRELGFKQKFNEKNQSLVVSIQHVEKNKAAKKPITPQATETKPHKPEVASVKPVTPRAEAKVNTKTDVPDKIIQKKPEKVATTDKPVAKEKNKTGTKKHPPILEAITFDAGTNRGEMILFKLNDFYPPIVFGLEESLPRVVCDFMNTKAAATVPNVIKCDGKFIKAVRVGRHANPDKVRVVLDLAANNNYDLQQVFFKEDNLFVIIVNTLSESADKTDQ